MGRQRRSRLYPGPRERARQGRQVPRRQGASPFLSPIFRRNGTDAEGWQIAELTDQITSYEDQVKLLISNAAPRASAEHGEGEGEDFDDGVSDISDDETEDRFVDLEEDLANVIADVHDLGAFPFSQLEQGS